MKLNFSLWAKDQAGRRNRRALRRRTNYQLMVIDGGTANTGEKLVKHLKEQFGANVSFENVL